MTQALKRLRAAALLAALGSSGVAAAGETPTPTPTPSPKPAAVSAEPQSTTATFGDWVLRCEHPAGGQRLCEVAQSLEVKGQGVIAQLAFGRVPGKEGLKLTVLLPNNVSLTSGVRVAASAKDENPADLAWRRSLPVGCVADADVKEEWLKVWKAQAATPGLLRYALASGQAMEVAFSFRGLGVALENLAKAQTAQ